MTKQVKFFNDKKQPVPEREATLAVELDLTKDGTVRSSRWIRIDRRGRRGG